MGAENINGQSATVSAMLILAALLLASCTNSKRSSSEGACALLSARVVAETFRVEPDVVTSRAAGETCSYGRVTTSDTFLTVTKFDPLGSTPLESVAVGDSVTGVGDEALKSDSGGELGSVAAVRVGNRAVRVDLGAVGDVAPSAATALALAEKASKKLPSARDSVQDGPGSMCREVEPLTTRLPFAVDRLRDLGPGTCELGLVDAAGSAFVSESMPAGADEAQLETAAGSSAVPVDIASGARWVAAADGRGGSLWVLDGHRLLQFNALDAGSQDQQLQIATDLARAFVASEGRE